MEVPEVAREHTFFQLPMPGRKASISTTRSAPLEQRGKGIGHHQPDVVADDADAIELRQRCQFVMSMACSSVISGAWLAEAAGPRRSGTTTTWRSASTA